MTNFFIFTALILIAISVWQITKIFELSQTKKINNQIADDKDNDFNGKMMFAFLIFIYALTIYSFFAYGDVLLPDAASEHGSTYDNLMWISFAVIFFVQTITQGALHYFSYKYRGNKSRKAFFYADNDRLEMIWTVIPAIVLVGLIGWGLVKWNNIMGPPPKDAEVIEIMGYQFAWASRYPGPDNELGDANYKLIDVDNIVGIDFTDSSSLDDFMPREIHIPKGKPVLFKIKARDVIHSVYLPYMRSQMNAVPGMPTQMWFIPTKTTAEMREETGNENFNFEIVCNKICGRAHFSMKHTVIVEEEWEYIKWKNEQKSWIEKNPDYYANFVKNNSTDVAVLND